MDLDEIKQYLRNAPSNWGTRDSAGMKEFLKQAKEQAVVRQDQALAKDLWCLERILETQDEYIAAFLKMKEEQFYQSWCCLEKSEQAAMFLAPHFDDERGQFHLPYIKKHVRQFQSLFPYALFLSPEFVHKEKCSICGQLITPRNACNHTVGDIYDGEMCSREMVDVQFCGAALVKHPVQKYSVPFFSDPKSGTNKDHYDYWLVRNLAYCLQSPFHSWDVAETRIRHPHTYFKDVGRNDLCPCGSGLKYKKCCLPESGVLRPHFQFKFEVPPPAEMRQIRYHYGTKGMFGVPDSGIQ